jgi:hypothetical protein
VPFFIAFFKRFRQLAGVFIARGAIDFIAIGFEWLQVKICALHACCFKVALFANIGILLASRRPERGAIAAGLPKQSRSSLAIECQDDSGNKKRGTTK